jgi:hypothetical protein
MREVASFTNDLGWLYGIRMRGLTGLTGLTGFI